jgi:hypothetical protein
VYASADILGVYNLKITIRGEDEVNFFNESWELLLWKYVIKRQKIIRIIRETQIIVVGGRRFIGQCER